MALDFNIYDGFFNYQCGSNGQTNKKCFLTPTFTSKPIDVYPIFIKIYETLLTEIQDIAVITSQTAAQVDHLNNVTNEIQNNINCLSANFDIRSSNNEELPMITF